MPAKKAVKKVAKKMAKKSVSTKKASKKAKPSLKPRQEAFIENYIANGGKNATDAARKAGVKGTDGAVRVTAHRMLTNANVQTEIQERTRERLKGLKASGEELYYLLSDHLRADIGDLSYCFSNGKFDLTLAKKKDLSRLIRKYKTRETSDGEITTEIELHDSQAAAQKLARMFGMEQQPRQNDDDVARVKAELAKLVSEGWAPENARQIVIEAEPTAARWLN